VIAREFGLGALADMPSLGGENGGGAGGGAPEVDLDPPDRAGRGRRGGPATVSFVKGPGGWRRAGAVKDLHQPDEGGIRRGGRTGAQSGQEILRSFTCRAGRANPFGAEDHRLTGDAFGLPGAKGMAERRAEGGVPIMGNRIDQGGHGRIIAENQASAYVA